MQLLPRVGNHRIMPYSGYHAYTGSWLGVRLTTADPNRLVAMFWALYWAVKFRLRGRV